MARTKEEALQELIRRGVLPEGATFADARQKLQEMQKQRAASQQDMGGSQEEAAQQQQPDFLSRLANNPATNFVLGAGDAVRNNLANVANLVPGININPVQSAEGGAYTAGNIGGELASYLGAAGGAGALLKGAQGLSRGGELAKLLAQEGKIGFARRMLGNAAYGAVTNPDERLKGAGEGAAISGALDILPGIAGKAAALTQHVRPHQYAKELLQEIGGGQTLEKNAKLLAQQLRESKKNIRGISDAQYNSVFSNMGDRALNPVRLNYLKLPEKTVNNLEKLDSKVAELHNEFIANPTFKNAHELQSEIGSYVRNKGKGANLSLLDQRRLERISNARKALKTDIKDFLSNQENPNLANKYKEATQFYRTDVRPYEEAAVKKIIKGIKENPRDLANLFASPTDAVRKIMEHLGEKGATRIIYSDLGKIAHKPTPEKVLERVAKLDEKGLGSIVPEALQNKLQTLKDRVENRDVASKLIGLAAGATLGSGTAIPFEIASSLGGLFLSPIAMRMASNNLPIDKITKALTGPIKKSYKPTKTAIKALGIPEGREEKKEKLLNLTLRRGAAYGS